MKLGSIDDTHVHFQNVCVHTKTQYKLSIDRQEKSTFLNMFNIENYNIEDRSQKLTLSLHDR